MEDNLKLEGNFEWKTVLCFFLFTFLCAIKNGQSDREKETVHNFFFPERRD